MKEAEEWKLPMPAAAKPKPHSLVLEDRQKATVSGVLEVESFHEKEILLRSEAGMMTLFGSGLHITKLDLDHGQLIVDGRISGVEYQDAPVKERSMLARLFR